MNEKFILKEYIPRKWAGIALVSELLAGLIPVFSLHPPPSDLVLFLLVITLSAFWRFDSKLFKLHKRLITHLAFFAIFSTTFIDWINIKLWSWLLILNLICILPIWILFRNSTPQTTIIKDKNHTSLTIPSHLPCIQILIFNSTQQINKEYYEEQLNKITNCDCLIVDKSISSEMSEKIWNLYALEKYIFYVDFVKQSVEFSHIPPWRGLVSVILKRVIDIFLSLLVLVFILPLWIWIVVCLRRLQGKVFFRQRRVGVDGREFSMFKFQTMYDDSDRILRDYLESSLSARREFEIYRKLRNDPRVTPMGRFLRRFSLDELPQLINVLRGDMSLVGVRPILAREIPLYRLRFDNFRLYCLYKPGMTGFWQVKGRNLLSFRDRVELDYRYITDWSWWMEIGILFATFGVIYGTKGAY